MVTDQVYTTAPATQCCASATNCNKIGVSGWTCSNTFTDTTAAASICPFILNTCGSKKNITIANVGDAVNISVNIPLGEACFFRLDAACGFPKVLFNGATDLIDISYIDKDEGDDDVARRILQALDDLEDDGEIDFDIDGDFELNGRHLATAAEILKNLTGALGNLSDKANATLTKILAKVNKLSTST